MAQTKVVKKIKKTKRTVTIDGETTVLESVLIELKTIKLTKRELADQKRCLAWFAQQKEIVACTGDL